MTISLQVQIKDAELKAVLAKIDERLKNRRPLYKVWGLEWLRWSDMNFKRGGSPAWHPLAPSTIAGRRMGRGKGGAQILRDRGNLANSAVYNPNGEDLRIGYSDEKAAWHHFGTRAHIIRPKKAGGWLRFFAPAGEGMGRDRGRPRRGRRARDVVFAKIVHHPGLPRRRLLPTAFQVLNEMRIVEHARRYLLERLGKGK